MKKAFLRNYCEKYNLEDANLGVKLETNPLPIDAWERT